MIEPWRIALILVLAVVAIALFLIEGCVSFGPDCFGNLCWDVLL
jgi:hypothetical protein